MRGLVLPTLSLLLGVASSSAAASDDAPVTRSFPVRVGVDGSGAVTSAEAIAKVPDALLGSILAAARLAEFDPATKNGVPVASRTTVSVWMTQDEGVVAEVTGVRAGGGFTMMPPRYPSAELRAGHSGIVWVLAAFGHDGRGDVARSSIESVRVELAGGPRRSHGQAEAEAGFREAALAAVADWTHAPEEVEGQGVALVMRVPVTFCSSRHDCTGLRAEAATAHLADAAVADVRLASLK